MNKKNIVMYHVFMMLTFVMMMFVSSCRDQVSEDLEKDIHVVNNKNSGTSELRSIGSESFYENYVNIEDFKNFQYESDVMWRKHEDALNEVSKIDRIELNGEMFDEEMSDEEKYRIFYESSLSFNDILEKNELGTFDNFPNKRYLKRFGNQIKPFVEVFFKENNGVYIPLSPKESYHFTYDERLSIRSGSYFKNGVMYSSRYFFLNDYCMLTNIQEKIFKDLRIITVTMNQVQYRKISIIDGDRCAYLYQLPFIDNYKDYQNESLTVDDERLLKKYIKPGSVFFVYDKPLGTLNIINKFIFNSGHSIIVTDLWYDLPDNLNSSQIKSDGLNQYGYQSLDQYKKVDEGKDFMSVEELRKDAFDDNVSLRDYLKRFVFIEAVTDSLNDNSKIPLSDKKYVVKYTSGNDKSALKRFDGYTVFAISNLNKGYNITNPLSKQFMINHSKSRIGNGYIFPLELDNKIEENYERIDYCSGIVYFGYLDDKLNFLKILTEKHKSNFRVHDESSFKWYMPRTLTNSPFFYTRTSYRENK